MMMTFKELKRVCDRLGEVNLEYRIQLDALREVMPCGHIAQYVYPPDGDRGTTRYCLECHCEALKERIAVLERELARVITIDNADNVFLADKITDGFCNFWPRFCPKCGALNIIIRPGDCRCSADCGKVDDRIMP